MMMIANLLLKLERNVKQFCFEVAPERCKWRKDSYQRRKCSRHVQQPQKTVDRRVLTGGSTWRPELALRQTGGDVVMSDVSCNVM